MNEICHKSWVMSLFIIINLVLDPNCSEAPSEFRLLDCSNKIWCPWNLPLRETFVTLSSLTLLYHLAWDLPQILEVFDERSWRGSSSSFSSPLSWSCLQKPRWRRSMFSLRWSDQNWFDGVYATSKIISCYKMRYSVAISQKVFCV